MTAFKFVPRTVSKLYSKNRNGRERLIGVYGRMSSATRVVDKLISRDIQRYNRFLLQNPSHAFHWEDDKLFMHYWFYIRFPHGKRREIHRKFEIREESI